MKKTKKIVLAGILLCMAVILGRFLAIKTPIAKISFGYVPLFLSGILLGPVYTAIIGGLNDLIGATLFPFGSYFVGYTISAVIKGFLYGALLHKRYTKQISDKEFLIRLIIVSVLQLILVNGVLNTFWIVITQDKAFWVIAGSRIIKELIMLPVQVITMFALDKALKPAVNKFLRDEEVDVKS